MENLSTIFQIQTKMKHIKSLSFITQFKIEFLLPFTGCRKCLEKCLINIKTSHPNALTSFSFFVSFNSCVFISFVFCISPNKMNSILCDVCLSFKGSHLELFCKIIIQLFSTCIFLGLWSRGPPCNFIELIFSCASLNGCFRSIN